jgi:hypothetical protein
MKLCPLSFISVGLTVFAFGCSDAPARPAKVGLYVMIRNPEPNVPEVAGRSCPSSSGIEWDIGKAIKDPNTGKVIDVDSPTPTDFGTTLEDGQNGAEIACTVRSGGSFISKGFGLDPQIMPPDHQIRFQMRGTGKKGGTPATNTVISSFHTPVTQEVASNPGFPGCIITSVHEQAPGALWADFDCPALTQTGSPSVACHASGTLVLEYCKTGEEDE